MDVYSEDISPKSGHHRQSSTEDPGTTIGKLLSLPQLKTNFMAMECEMRYQTIIVVVVGDTQCLAAL